MLVRHSARFVVALVLVLCFVCVCGVCACEVDILSILPSVVLSQATGANVALVMPGDMSSDEVRAQVVAWWGEPEGAQCMHMSTPPPPSQMLSSRLSADWYKVLGARVFVILCWLSIAWGLDAFAALGGYQKTALGTALGALMCGGVAIVQWGGTPALLLTVCVASVVAIFVLRGLSEAATTATSASGGGSGAVPKGAR